MQASSRLAESELQVRYFMIVIILYWVFQYIIKVIPRNYVYIYYMTYYSKCMHNFWVSLKVMRIMRIIPTKWNLVL